MNPRLIPLSGPLKDSVFQIPEPGIRVGRAADNNVVVDDELASKYHFAVWLKNGRSWLKDGDTRNGTWINGLAHSERFLEPGDRIKCGSTTFLYLEGDEDPETLPTIIQNETDRNRELETLRADYSVRGDAAIHYKGISQSFVRLGNSLNAIPDPVELKNCLLDSAFEVIPALRGAILLNGNRVGPDRADFISETYRERDFDGAADRLVLSGRVLEEVYAHRRPVSSNNVTPVMCAPLIMPVSNTMLGVLYLEGRDPQRRQGNGFEPEHLYYLKGIAEFAVVAIRLGGKFESLSDANTLLIEERRLASVMIGKSEAILAVFEKMRKAAKFGATVLITGETGTGKEMVARGIHEMSARREKPYVAINCGAIPDSLLESELFGHVKGGFTGATAPRKGKFKMADGGTVFLDEIGEMGIDSQTRLLRVLQEREFSPVGGDQTVTVDIQVIAATNVNLEEAVQQKAFREDLFYRLNVMEIEVPPLRERKEDIPLLAAHFLQKYDAWRGVTAITPEAMAAMMSYSWPGNIRELENVVQAAIINGDSETLRLEDLPKRVTEGKAALPTNLRSKGRRAARKVQRADVEARMKMNGGDAEETGRFFSRSRSWVYELLSEDL